MSEEEKEKIVVQEIVLKDLLLFCRKTSPRKLISLVQCKKCSEYGGTKLIAQGLDKATKKIKKYYGIICKLPTEVPIEEYVHFTE